MDDYTVHCEYPSGHKVVTAEVSHVDHIATNMRKADTIEVELMGYTPETALLNALKLDYETFTVLDDKDVPYAMFGCGKGLEGYYIWMLGTDDVQKNRREFIKYSRKWVHGFVGIYEKVYNYVHIDNLLAVRWLRWCGAEMSPIIDFKGYKICKFEIHKENLCV